MPQKDLLEDNLPIKLSKKILNIYHTKSLNTTMEMPGLKSKENNIPQVKLDQWSSIKWKKLHKIIWVKLSVKLLLQSLLISMILRDKPLKMQEKFQDLMFKELSMNLLLLL